MKGAIHETMGETARNRVNIFIEGFSCASRRVSVPACASLREPASAVFRPAGEFQNHVLIHESPRDLAQV